MTVVMLLSGGLDSGTLLSKLVLGGEDVIPISFRYGQRHADQELFHAQKLVQHFGLESKWKVISIESLFSSSDPSVLLNSASEMPHKTYAEIATDVGPSPTYVPYRNGIFISIATSLALQLDAEAVYIATHAEDARNWAYPDCTFEFNASLASAVYVGTYMKVRLLAPFQFMMKSDIVRTGVEIGVPFDLMWSCYEGGDRPCGTCPTCVERAEAFRVNSVKDPLE